MQTKALSPALVSPQFNLRPTWRSRSSVRAAELEQQLRMPGQAQQIPDLVAVGRRFQRLTGSQPVADSRPTPAGRSAGWHRPRLSWRPLARGALAAPLGMGHDYARSRTPPPSACAHEPGPAACGSGRHVAAPSIRRSRLGRDERQLALNLCQPAEHGAGPGSQPGRRWRHQQAALIGLGSGPSTARPRVAGVGAHSRSHVVSPTAQCACAATN
jgi:hypothetical protein